MRAPQFLSTLALALSIAGSVVQAQSSVTVTLRNDNFGSVLVEAQIEGGSSLGPPRRLSKGQSWPISCPKAGGVLYRSREDANGWGEWIRASCGFDFSYRISDGGRVGGAGKDGRGCDVLASRGANASHARLTDGVIGSTSQGQNSGKPGGTFWVDLSPPARVHHVTLHPFMNGTVGTHTVVGYSSVGVSATLATSHQGSSSAPFSLEVDPSKSGDMRRVEVNVIPDNGKDWVAFTEIEIFVCR